MVASKEAVVSPIIGATKISHLLDALPAIDLQIDPADISYLERAYLPHEVVGAI